MRPTADLRSTARRGGVLTLATFAAVALLAGCGAGQNSQTTHKKPSVSGVNADLGSIALRDVQIEYADREERSYAKGEDVPLNVRVFNSGPASDTLVGVSTKVADEVRLIGSKGESSGVCPAAEVSVPPVPKKKAPSPTASATGPDGATPGATPGADESEPPGSPDAKPEPKKGTTDFEVELPPGSCALLIADQPYHLELSGLHERLSPGDRVAVTFTFREAGSVTVRVPFGMPTGGADHEPEEMHPEEPHIVDGGHE